MSNKDAELLARAARVAGPTYVNLLSHGKWDPLNNWDQAMTLSVQFAVNVGYLKPMGRTFVTEVSAYPSGQVDCLSVEPVGNDAAPSVRRAIVCAVAALDEEQTE